jgi:23S rRNA U2552 (ribose-2'-O)-methylase RlmE/FtsJ
MSTPWSRFQLYPRTVQNLSRQFLTESYEQKHEYEDEECHLHEQRNRIQVYESHLPPGKNWEYYKKAVNPYEWVYTQKKYVCFPESVCQLKPLSRSYFKMVEILELSSFFSRFPVQTPLRTAHVCEGPGGFIEAIYDESAKRGHRCHQSFAMTLRSRQSHVPSWRKAAQFLKRNRSVQVVYGEDGTGDILKPENQQSFIDHVVYETAHQRADLFTADGGFDVSENYQKQETLLFPLLVASTKIGLEVLKKGGCFILKMFDCYRRATSDLLYFLSCHFEQWSFYKPGMSRPCNPEHYFIGCGFLGCTEEALDAMRLWCLLLQNNEPLEALFRKGYEYDTRFSEWLRSHRTQSYHTQMEHLSRVFSMIEREKAGEELRREELEENEHHSVVWCERFCVPLSPSLMISSLSPSPSPSTEVLQSDPRETSLPQWMPDVVKDDLPPSGPTW